MTSEFGQKLRQLRRENSLTQSDLATLIDLTVPYISRVETGKVSNVGRRTAENIRLLFEDSLHEFEQEDLFWLALGIDDEMRAKLVQETQTAEFSNLISQLPSDTVEGMIQLAEAMVYYPDTWQALRETISQESPASP